LTDSYELFVQWDVSLPKQEAQLMLTNPRDAFRGQSRSPNMVPFHISSVQFRSPTLT